MPFLLKSMWAIFFAYTGMSRRVLDAFSAEQHVFGFSASQNTRRDIHGVFLDAFSAGQHVCDPFQLNSTEGVTYTEGFLMLFLLSSMRAIFSA